MQIWSVNFFSIQMSLMIWHMRVVLMTYQVGHTSLVRHYKKIRVTGAVFCIFVVGEGQCISHDLMSIPPEVGEPPSPLRIIDLTPSPYLTHEEMRSRFIPGPMSWDKVGSLRFLSILRLPFPMFVCSLFAINLFSFCSNLYT